MTKDAFPGLDNQRGGFSTLEILIAMAVLIMVLSAAIAVAFGGQSVLTDAEIAAEALKKAQGLIEESQLLARKDFHMVNPRPETVDGIYWKRVEVETAPDNLTKKVTSVVRWRGEHGRDLSTTLTALVTNFENAKGGNTCNSVVAADRWQAPSYRPYYLSAGDLLPLGMTGVFPASDIDVYRGILYVVSADTMDADDNTLFIFDASNPDARPVAVGFADNAPTRRDGIAAIHADGTYLYAASAVHANYGVCVEGTACAQLQIFNVADPGSPVLVKSYRIPGVSGSAGQAIGTSIFYKDGYVYLGLSKTASGPEFLIVDVRDPVNPFFVGGWSVGHAVNAITVVRNFAYLATADTNRELTVIDISNPADPTFAGKFDAAGGASGLSIHPVGDTLYFGRTLGGEEFYVIDISNPATTLSAISSFDLGNESVAGISIRDFLAFILTRGEFRIFDVSNPDVLTPHASSFLLSSVFPNGRGEALECEGDTLYIGGTDSDGDENTPDPGVIIVVRPT